MHLRNIRNALEHSLQRLNTEESDLYSSAYNHHDYSKPKSQKSKKRSFLGSLFSRKNKEGERKPNFTTALGREWNADNAGQRTLPSI